MTNNLILPFGQGANANVETDAAYSADTQRPVGHQPGVAKSALMNKAMLQASAMAVGLAQFLADNQGTDVTDQLTGSTLSGMIKSAALAAIGGSFRSFLQISAATALTAAQSGSFIEAIGSGTGYTVTLPAPAIGLRYSFYNAAATSSINITTPSGTIYAGGAGATTRALRTGDSIELVSDGINWIAYNGSGSVSLSGNGYLKFPSGLIINWGAGTYSAATAVTFPLAYPTACAQVIMGPGNYDPNAADYQKVVPVAAYSPTLTGFTASSARGSLAGAVAGAWTSYGW